MKKWEYKVIANKDYEKNKWMQTLGKSGWELIVVVGGAGYLKYFF